MYGQSEATMMNLQIGKMFPDLDRALERISLEELIYLRLKPVFDRLELVKIENFYKFVIHQVERPLLRLALEKSQGNQSLAAKMLGINRNTLRKKISQLEIDLDLVKTN